MATRRKKKKRYLPALGWREWVSMPELGLESIRAKVDTGATTSARVMGLHIAGVDLIRSNRGPLVLEVNSSPGLAGVEMATGKDVAGKVVKFLEKQRQSKPVRRRRNPH